MKPYCLLVALLVLCCMGQAAPCVAVEDGVAVRVGLLHGQAWQLPADEQGESIPLLEGQDLLAPFLVRVEQGARLELLLPGGALRLAGPAMCGVERAWVEQGKRHLAVKLSHGESWLSLGAFGASGDELRITLPTAVLKSAGGQSRIQLGKDRRAFVEVFSGTLSLREDQSEKSAPQRDDEARLEQLIMDTPQATDAGAPTPLSRGGVREITAGQFARIGLEGRINAEDDLDDDMRGDDPWVRWNLHRDKEQGRH
jgi:hypothetical protein